MNRPKLGARVHYLSHGSPVLPDGSQRYLPACRMADVTDPDPFSDTVKDSDAPAVSLFVVNPTGFFLNAAVPYEDAAFQVGGTWHDPKDCGQ